MNHDEILEFVNQYCEKEKLNIGIKSYSLTEDHKGATVSLSIVENGEVVSVKGQGVGLVDASYNALMSRYSDHYISLNTVELVDAYFRTDLENRDYSSTMKSRMLINLVFKNASENSTDFRNKTTSLSYSAVGAIVQAFEFYINCEILFKRVRFLVKEATSRNRADVSQHYKYVLSKVVQVTNYKCVL